MGYQGVLVAEGDCPYGCGRLTVWDHFGQKTGACWQCRCSWRYDGETVWGLACVPGDHTCGKGSQESGGRA